MTHSPEPWTAVELPVFGPYITSCDKTTVRLDTDNTKRIVACVNACEGIKTEALECVISAGVAVALEEENEH
jgi:hypothetical protein